MDKYKVILTRTYEGYIVMKANSEEEAIKKVEEYEYEDDEKFIVENIGDQSVHIADKINK